LFCALAVAQSAERPPLTEPPGVAPRANSPRGDNNLLPGPHLSPAQELVYRGLYTEESTGGGVQFNRVYRLEYRVFVLETSPPGARVAFLTVLKPRHLAPGLSSAVHEEQTPGSVRLALGQVDSHGHVAVDGVSLTAPLDGPAINEFGAFLELPAQRLTAGQGWVESEDGRPERVWEMLGHETVNGTSCLKLSGEQHSADWDRPRSDRGAWKRQDTVWLAPRLGVAYRVERIIERREPGRQQPGWRSVSRYEMASGLSYTPHLYEDCRDDILKVHAFQQAALSWMADPSRHGPDLDSLLAKIDHHLDKQTPTPYREAMVHLKRRVEAARRGESVPGMAPAAPAPEAPANRGKAEPGSTAPDFLAPHMLSRELVRLRQWYGRPVMLVFYNPSSVTAEEVLQFAQSIQDTYKGHVAVVGMVMSEDAERVRKQRDALNLTFPLLDGTGLRQTYEIEATPKLLLLDAQGVVRCSQLGWGQETPSAVFGELRRALQAPR
jgi:peroxiredoxin